MVKTIFLSVIISLYICADDNSRFIDRKDKKLVNEANQIFEDTVISRLTHKLYKIEVSAAKASIAMAKMGKIIPVKYRDDLGRVGFMKNKPIIATAKKFLKFMKENHLGEVIYVKNPKNYKDLCKVMCGKEGLYIIRTEDNLGYKLTGYILPWKNTHVLGNKDYIKYAKEAWLFVNDENISAITDSGKAPDAEPAPEIPSMGGM